MVFISFIDPFSSGHPRFMESILFVDTWKIMEIKWPAQQLLCMLLLKMKNKNGLNGFFSGKLVVSDFEQ